MGAHNLESMSSRLVSILIDGVLALDAGSLSSGLSLAEQGRLEAILLSHQHYDHLKDLPTLGLACMGLGTKAIYAPAPVLEELRGHLFNGRLYPDFTAKPSPEKPAFRLFPVEPRQPLDIQGYRVTAFPISHTPSSVAYEVRAPGGPSLLYTGDTGPGLASLWGEVSPRLLITELTGPDSWEETMLEGGHLTPKHLKAELSGFRKLKGYLPQVVLVHMNPTLEHEIGDQVREMARELGASLELAREGMRLEL